MIWSFADVLEYLSQDFTFVPGDVIAGGTSAGTAADKSRRSPDGKRPLDLFLKVGDTVEVSSSKIGALANKIVAERSEPCAFKFHGNSATNGALRRVGERMYSFQ